MGNELANLNLEGDFPTFSQCLAAALANREFVENWARLRAVQFPLTPIERMVDEASGHGNEIALQFIRDVADLVMDRLPPPKGAMSGSGSADNG